MAACGTGGSTNPDGRPADGAGPDAAGPDAASPDAGPPDAAPDAGPPCDLPAFTAGVSTLAGCDVAGAVDGAREVARFRNPVNVRRGPDGDLYVADFDNHRIRVVDATGAVRTLVAQAGFQRPFGLTFGPDGTLYVQTDRNDAGQQSPQTGTIWAVDPSTGAARVVVRDVGRPRGLLALPDGRIVLADYVHHTIRILEPTTGAITLLAGALDEPGHLDADGAAARFAGPYGLARLPDGRVAVADLFNHRIRAVALDGAVTTLAGTGSPGAADGPAEAATFTEPQDLAIDDAGVLYVADTGGHVIRRLAAGEVTTLIGDGVAGWRDDDDLRAARLHGAEGIDVAPDGTTLWIADGTRGEDLPYHRLRVVALP
jgi:sugar lactone lactonase YvrE